MVSMLMKVHGLVTCFGLSPSDLESVLVVVLVLLWAQGQWWSIRLEMMQFQVPGHVSS
jgi:hypothetical protein